MSPGVKVGSRGLFASCVAQHVTDQFGRHVPSGPFRCGACVCCDFALPAFTLPCTATPRHRVEGVATMLHFGRRPRVGTPSRSSARCERVTGTLNFARRDASYGGREDNAPSTNPLCASLNALSPGRYTSRPAAIKIWYPIPYTSPAHVLQDRDLSYEI